MMRACTGSRRPLVYVVDDDSRLAGVVCQILDRAGFATESFEDGRGVLAAVGRRQPDVVLLDLMLPDVEGGEVLRRIREHLPEMPVVMMSGKGTVRTAVESLKLGAYDFLEKPLDADRLRVTVRNALEQRRLQKQVVHLRGELGEEYRLVGDSAALQRVRKLVERVAPTTASVLITGESGVGKEVVARLVHLGSLRADEPFVALNCAAIPENLLESELFGYEKGAFSGAVSGKPGKLEQADAGTLFLDEIGDMSPATQAKLLRFLETSELQRLGGSETVRLDVRLVAATNKDLAESIRQGKFRDDLFHRLNVVAIHVPPLRDRREDVPMLAGHFLLRFRQKHGRPDLQLDDGCLAMLKAYDWPGNVRELRNLVERTVVLCHTDRVQAEEMLSFLAADPGQMEDGTLRSALDQAERAAVERALIETQGNVTEAARLLGVERPSLHRIMKRHGLDAPRFRSAGESESQSGVTVG